MSPHSFIRILPLTLRDAARGSYPAGALERGTHGLHVSSSHSSLLAELLALSAHSRLLNLRFQGVSILPLHPILGLSVMNMCHRQTGGDDSMWTSVSGVIWQLQQSSSSDTFSLLLLSSGELHLMTSVIDVKFSSKKKNLEVLAMNYPKYYREQCGKKMI